MRGKRDKGDQTLNCFGEGRPCAREPERTLPTDSALVGMPFAPALVASMLERSWLALGALFEPGGLSTPSETRAAPPMSRRLYPVQLTRVTGGRERHMVSSVHPVPHHHRCPPEK